MKRIMLVNISLLLLLFCVQSVSAQSGMLGSKHDFSSQNWAGTNEVCKVCHTPHNVKEGKKVLWNRESSEASSYPNNLVTTFGTTWGIPDGPTLMCLSCHDGTIGMENFGTGGFPIQDVAPLKRVGFINGSGASLAEDHPVSIFYTPGLIPAQLNDEASVRAAGLRLTGPEGSGKVECSTCHDVHNKNVIAGTMLLRVTKSGSSLCIVCHNK